VELLVLLEGSERYISIYFVFFGFLEREVVISSLENDLLSSRHMNHK
jgi:hypothetical protein